MANDPFSNNNSGNDFDPFLTGAGQQDEEFEIEIDDPTLSLIPIGNHPARLVDVSFGTSKAGNPMYTWEFVIMSAQHSGQTISTFTALSKQAMWKVEQVLRGLGLLTSDPLSGGKTSLKFKRSDAINRMCILKVGHGEYQGRVRENIDDVLPHPDGVGKKWQMGGISFGAPAPVEDTPWTPDEEEPTPNPDDSEEEYEEQETVIEPPAPARRRRQ